MISGKMTMITMISLKDDSDHQDKWKDNYDNGDKQKDDNDRDDKWEKKSGC